MKPSTVETTVRNTGVIFVFQAVRQAWPRLADDGGRFKPCGVDIRMLQICNFLRMATFICSFPQICFILHPQTVFNHE
jgi:hypothetical protein